MGHGPALHSRLLFGSPFGLHRSLMTLLSPCLHWTARYRHPRPHVTEHCDDNIAWRRHCIRSTKIVSLLTNCIRFIKLLIDERLTTNTKWRISEFKKINWTSVLQIGSLQTSCWSTHDRIRRETCRLPQSIPLRTIGDMAARGYTVGLRAFARVCIPFPKLAGRQRPHTPPADIAPPLHMISYTASDSKTSTICHTRTHTHARTHA
jgi:hypothetical protein